MKQLTILWPEYAGPLPNTRWNAMHLKKNHQAVVL